MACNCNEEGKIINIGMGCCVPIVANADAYYTKSEIDEKIDEIVTSGCCITPEEVDEKISAATDGYATEEWVEDQGYLKTHQSLDGYVTDDDLSAYTYDKETIDEKIAQGGTFDPTQYYNKTQTNALLDNKLDVSAYTPTDLSNYYTKTEVDEKIPSLSGYATEQWVEDKGYLTEHQPLKTINGETLVGSGDIVITSSTTDLSNYYNKQEVDNLMNSISSDVTQYFTNLQQQINSLIQTISGCCGSSGETQYRWIIMTGENDYWCDGTVKKSLEKQQSSTDGLNWSDTGVIRSGSTVLEYDSSSCGYDINSGLKITLANGNVITYDCEDLETVTCSGVTKYKLTHDMVMSAITTPNDVKKIEIGTCVDLIGSDAFSGLTNLQKVVIPSSFKSESLKQCDGIDDNAFEGTAIRTVGLQESGADVEWNNNMDDIAFGMFKGCTSLVSVDLHNGFKTFAPYVFSGCTNLQSITIRSSIIPVLNSYAQSGYQYDALDGIGNNTFVIYVPSDMVDAYKNSVDNTGYKNWSKYADRIEPIS